MQVIKEKIDRLLGKVLILVETLIAIVSTLILVGLLVVQLYHICTDPSTFAAGDAAVTNYLHHMLTIIIGLEFIKLLMHLTPANILEVLTMAIARGIIVNHGTAVDNLLSIACIVGLFAARRFLIPKSELHRDLDEDLQDPTHHRRHNRKHNHHNHSHKKDDHSEVHHETAHH